MDRTALNLAAASVALLACVACAGTPPVERIEGARQAISAAERAGAYSDAPLELYVARERFEEAKAAMLDKKYEKARRLAEDAAANAELARAKADSARNERAANEVRVDVDAMVEELERRSARQ